MGLTSGTLKSIARKVTLELIYEVIDERTGEIKNDVKNVKTDIQNIKTDIQNIKNDVQNVKTDIQNIKNDVKNVREEIYQIKADVRNINLRLEQQFLALNTRLDQLFALFLQDRKKGE